MANTLYFYSTISKNRGKGYQIFKINCRNTHEDVTWLFHVSFSVNLLFLCPSEAVSAFY